MCVGGWGREEKRSAFSGALPGGPGDLQRGIVHDVHKVVRPVRERRRRRKVHRGGRPPEHVGEPQQRKPGPHAARHQRFGHGGAEVRRHGGAAGGVVVEEVAGVVGGVDAVLEARLGGARQRRQQQPRERRVRCAGPAMAAGGCGE